MSKTLLVAQREFVENLRTKTFWIGILALPLLLTIFTVVSRVLARSKDQRAYAVLDLSQDAWLSQEIAQRALNSDLDQWLRKQGSTKPEAKPQSVAELRAQWQTARQKLEQPSLQRLLDVFENMADDDLQTLLEAETTGRPPFAVMLKYAPQFTAALRDVDQKQIQRMFAGMAGGKFKQVPIDDLRGDASAGDRDQIEAKLRERVNSGELFAYFVIDGDPESSDAACRYVSTNLTDDDLRDWYGRLATEVVRERRVAKLNLTKVQAASLQDEFTFAARTVSASGQEEEVKTEARVSQFAPIAFVYLLWIAVFSISQMLLTNTIEEKSNRILEVLLSSVSPHQLMTGKILGIAATGLTMVVSWVLVALVGSSFLPFDFDLQAIVAKPLYLASFLGYFLAGYLIYAAVLVAIGSLFNSLKESQNLATPVIWTLMVPLIAMFPVAQDPNGTVARVLTYIPLYTPFLMMNRANGPPPAWEYAASTVLILVTIAVAFWAAGKVFRVGILMTGKPPRLREIVGWLMPGNEPSVAARDPGQGPERLPN